MAGNKRPEGTTSLQVWIDKDTHKKFKAICSLLDTKMTEQVTKMIEDFVKECAPNGLVLIKPPKEGRKEE